MIYAYTCIIHNSSDHMMMHLFLVVVVDCFPRTLTFPHHIHAHHLLYYIIVCLFSSIYYYCNKSD